MRATLSLLILGLLLALAPPAFAQESDETKPERPDDAAWVDDCPPDMMCAASANESADGDKPTYDGDCGAEVCAYGNDSCIECSGPSDGGGAEPGQAIGPDGCIDCMTPPKDNGSNCMDGEQAGESCRDDVQYMAPPASGNGAPAEPQQQQPQDGQPEAGGKASVPGASLGAALGILAVAAVALALLTGRRRA